MRKGSRQMRKTVSARLCGLWRCAAGIRGLLVSGAVALSCSTVVSVPWALAQEPTVEAYADPPEVPMGEQFRLVVEVRGARTVESVVIPEFFEFAQCINPYDPFVHVKVGDAEAGVAANTVTLSYVFVASRAGFFEMRPFRITADGRDLETEAVAVLVSGRGDPVVKVRVDPPQVNVGDEFELRAEIVGSESEFFEFIPPDVFDFAERAGGSGGGGSVWGWDLRALEPGEFVVPPVRVVDRDNTYQSEPFTLLITDDPPSVEVRASVEAGAIWVGGEFSFRIDVSGAGELDEEPSLPRIADFAELLESPESSGPWFPSLGDRNVTRVYRFRAVKAGSFEIGPVRIVSGGRTFATEPVNVVVDQAPAGGTEPPEDLFLTAIAEQTRAYVGEPVIVTYVVLHDENDDWPSYGTKSWPAFDDFDVLDWQRWGFSFEMVLDGRDFRRSRLREVALLPRRPGQLDIGAATVEARVEKPWDLMDHWPRQRRSGTYSSSIALPEREYTSHILTSDPFTLEVLPLPDQDRPDSFRGHVGTLEVTSRLNGTRVDVGESLTLEVKVFVKGHVEGLADPEIDFPRGFEVSRPEMETKFTNRGDPLSGSRTYTYRLTATTPGTFVIPAIEMSYFDAESESYGTALGHPFTVTVVSAEEGKR